MKKHRLLPFFIFIFLSICAGFAFIVVTYLVKIDYLRQLDFNLIVKIQDKTPRSIDPLLSFVDLTGSFWILAPLLFVVSYMVKRVWGLFVVGMFGIGHLIEIFFKLSLHQPGPPFLFHRHYNELYFDKAYVIPGSSYPSGHSMRSVFVFVVFMYFITTSKRISSFKKLVLFIAMGSYALLIIATKAIFGEHWPSDLIGGSLLGATLGCMSLAGFRIFKK